MIRRVRALIVKEFHQIFRDPSSILIAFVFPLILLFIYGFGISLDIKDLKIGLVLQDTGSDAQSFALSMRNSSFFSIKFISDQKLAEEKLVSGELRGIVIVPFYFSEYERLQPDQQAPIYVIADGSDPNTANFVHNYVQSAWSNWQQQQSISNATKRPPRVILEPRFWYNEELDSRNFLIPGSIAIIMTLIGTLLTALVVAREWERGTIEALMATPVRMGEILFAKMFSYFCLGICSMFMCTLVAVWIFVVPLQGSLLALLLVSSLFLFAALGLGLLISSVARNQFVAAQISVVTAFLPAFMLSGFIFEISSMPLWIQWLTAIIPARYLVSSLQTIFLVGDVWELLFFNAAILGLIACVFFAIISLKTVKRLD